MEIVSIINRKGGVGKTATAHALGTGLIRKGFRVLFLDLDSQTNLSYALGATDNAPTSMDVLEKKVTAIQAIQKTAQGDLIAGDYNLSGADISINGTGKEYRLKEALDKLKNMYDYIIIDTPASLGTITVNALTASKKVIIPVQAEVYSLQGIGQLNEAINAVRTYCNQVVRIDGILITRYNSRAVLSRDMKSNLELVAKQLHTKLYSTPIRDCIAVREAQALKENIFSYAPKSNASLDYSKFVDEFLKGGDDDRRRK